MQKYVKVRTSFAKNLKAFISKRKHEKDRSSRFFGLMQENRKKEKKERQSYSNVDFEFDLDDVTKQVKF